VVSDTAGLERAAQALDLRAYRGLLFALRQRPEHGYWTMSVAMSLPSDWQTTFAREEYQVEEVIHERRAL